MEGAGKIRRRYFGRGLGAAQFALPGAVDRLRAERPPDGGPTLLLLAASDPANPYGSTLGWPKAKKLQRVSGAHLVLVDGEPALYVERSHKGLTTLAAFEQSAAPAVGALRRLAENAPRRELTIQRIHGESVLNSPVRALLEQVGFKREYLGLTLRLPRFGHPQARS